MLFKVLGLAITAFGLLMVLILGTKDRDPLPFLTALGAGLPCILGGLTVAGLGEIAIAIGDLRRGNRFGRSEDQRRAQ